MPRFDLSPDELRTYRPDVREPADFDEFWATTLAESRAFDSAPVLRPADTPITQFEVFDLTFGGFRGQPVRAWLVLPRGVEGPLPVVVEYNGYGGGRGLPHERLAWPAAGYAWALMDTRGQGSVWGSGGDTADPEGTGPSVPGFMTRGIDSAETYYYRRVYTDGVRLIDALRTLPQLDPSRIAVTGGSQGGGIAIAAASLSDAVVASMPDVPFLCHFERAVGMTGADPYGEVVRYLAVHREHAERTFETLSYFDGVNLAKRATAPALFSVALLDPVCPPSTVFAAANHWAGPASVVEYAFNEHEGGGGHQWPRQARFLAPLV